MSDSTTTEHHEYEPEIREPERGTVWTLSPELRADIMADDETDDNPSLLSPLEETEKSGEEFLLNIQPTTTRPTTRQKQDETDRCVLGQNTSAIPNNTRSLLPDTAIVGLKFRDYGPVFYCTAGNMTLGLGDFVMADCEQGLGKIVRILENPPDNLSVLLTEPAPGPQGLPDTISLQQQQDLPPLIRLATPHDMGTAEENSDLAVKARTFCQDCIRNLRLDMKLVDVEIYHDRSKIIFYFTAPTRIDFRELVKELVKSYRTRIELRQIGVRHETQMLGGIGNCGMVCCCRRYLRRFAPVTIKMAKEQNLFLNPAKISGLCGRLLCCLSYEQENYEHFHRLCPKIGKRYQTDQGAFKVLRVNMFRTSIIVLAEGAEEQELSIDDWKALHPTRSDPVQPVNGPGHSPGNVNGKPDGNSQSHHSGKPADGGKSGQYGSGNRSANLEDLANLPDSASGNGFGNAPGNADSAQIKPNEDGLSDTSAEPSSVVTPADNSVTASDSSHLSDKTDNGDSSDNLTGEASQNNDEASAAQSMDRAGESSRARSIESVPEEALSQETLSDKLSEEQLEEDQSIFGLSPQKPRFHKKPYKGNRG